MENTRSMTVGDGLFGPVGSIWAVDLNVCFHMNKSGKTEAYNYRNQR